MQPSRRSHTLGFTLHRHEAELGLIDMGGRVYDPRVGQFLEPDPLVTFAANTQEANPYAYALNNPLRYTDPSGFVPCDNSSGCGEGIQIGPFILGGLTPTAPGSEPPPGQAFNTFAPFLPGLSEYSSFGAFAQRGPGPSRPSPAHLRNLSESGLRFIAELEAFFPFPKDDGYGNLTVGFGYVPRPGEDFSGGMTRAQGMVLLRQKIRIHEDAVRKAITRPLSQRQFDALVSFSYNAGSAGLTESGVAAAVNAGNFDAAVTAMFTRVRAGKPSNISLGLVHRRVLEAELMLRGDYSGKTSESLEIAKAAYSSLTEGRKIIYR